MGDMQFAHEIFAVLAHGTDGKPEFVCHRFAAAPPDDVDGNLALALGQRRQAGKFGVFFEAIFASRPARLLTRIFRYTLARCLRRVPMLIPSAFATSAKVLP